MENIQLSKQKVPYSSLLVHYGEIALKGGNRSSFEGRLIRNITCALRGTGVFEVRRLPGRIWVDYADHEVSEKAVPMLQRVFGIANIAKAIRVSTNMVEIARGVDLLVSERAFSSFAVRTRRGEKSFPFTSVEVNAHIGSRVEAATGARVDLQSPEQEIGIEILDRHTFVFCDRFAGPGGLPLGSAGKVACLISGGIDSPVAAWRMMKRGCMPCYIHFSSLPFTNRASVEKVTDVVEQLSHGMEAVKLFVIPFGEVQQKIVAHVAEEYRVLLYRRFMLRIAETIAHEEGALALVTGEALSQVASQTLSNMRTIEAVATMPLLRPLVGMDKQEIVDEAKRIGTYRTSCEPHDDCCSFLMPKHPATHSTPDELDQVEASLDITELVQRAGVEKEVRAIS